MTRTRAGRPRHTSHCGTNAGETPAPHKPLRHRRGRDARATQDEAQDKGADIVRAFDLADKSLNEFDAHGYCVATAEAEGGDAALSLALLHLVHERDQYAGSGAADRMSEGDGAAVDVDAGGIES